MTVEELEKELADSKAKAEENIKALQKKLADKDLENKKILEEMESLKKGKGSEGSEAEKKIEVLTKQVETLVGKISEINTDKKREELAKKYPDILPDLLIGKSDEEAELIVNKQREITMQNYDEKPYAHAPLFKSTSEIDEAINRVKEDKSISTDAKFEKIRELKLKKEEL